MTEDVTRYPLCWPNGWKRRPGTARKWSSFRSGGERITVYRALDRLQDECDRLGATSAIVSSNLETKLNGQPRSIGYFDKQPADPGVALYFKLRGKDRCLACDRYLDVGGNVAAIAAHIEALRAIDRYGVGTLDQAFAGYTALPPSPAEWWLVLGLPRTASLDDVERVFRERARTAHPDAGGSHDAMATLSAARDAARRDLQQPVGA